MSFASQTVVRKKSRAVYRRPDDGSYVMKSKDRYDNRAVVPYNPVLTMLFSAHINTEIVTYSSAVKYLFKYCNKVRYLLFENKCIFSVKKRDFRGRPRPSFTCKTPRIRATELRRPIGRRVSAT